MARQIPRNLRNRPAPDPIQNAPRDRLAGAGSPFNNASGQRERAFVIGVDSARDAYRVRTVSGRVLTVLRIRSSMGDNDRIPIGTVVVLDYSLGSPYIDGILPLETAQVPQDNAESITSTVGHGGQDPVMNRNMQVGGRAAGEPNDILPGDFVRTSPDGAAVGALHGKVALLRGSSLAQVRAFGESNALEIWSGLFRHVSWMGESRIINQDGKTSYVFRGGADQLTQSGPDEERYTIRLDVGHTGDLFDFRITTPENQTLFRMHVDAQGRLELFAKGGFDQLGGGDGQEHPVRVQGAQRTEVTGEYGLSVGGAATQEFRSNRETSVTNNDTNNVGNDSTNRINRNYLHDSGGTHTTTSTGDMVFQARDGKLHLETGSGAIEHVTTSGHFKHTTNSGNVLFDMTSGTYTVRTRGADKIIFGDGASSHGTKYEELQTALNAWVQDYNQFKIQVGSHVHASVGSPSPTLPAVSTPYNLDMSQARSEAVKLK